MTNTKFGPWKIWNGGECPCPDKRVQVQRRSQARIYIDHGPAHTANIFAGWNHQGLYIDIIAYREALETVVTTETLYTGLDGLLWLAGVGSLPPRPAWSHFKATLTLHDGEPYEFGPIERIE